MKGMTREIRQVFFWSCAHHFCTEVQVDRVDVESLETQIQNSTIPVYDLTNQLECVPLRALNLAQ